MTYISHFCQITDFHTARIFNQRLFPKNLICLKGILDKRSVWEIPVEPAYSMQCNNMIKQKHHQFQLGFAKIKAPNKHLTALAFKLPFQMKIWKESLEIYRIPELLRK